MLSATFQYKSHFTVLHFAYACIRIFMHSYICIYMCISIIARIHTYHASWFPTTRKEITNYAERRIKDLGLAKKKKDVFYYANHVLIHFRNRIVKATKVIVEQGLLQQRSSLIDTLKGYL